MGTSPRWSQWEMRKNGQACLIIGGSHRRNWAPVGTWGIQPVASGGWFVRDCGLSGHRVAGGARGASGSRSGSGGWHRPVQEGSNRQSAIPRHRSRAYGLVGAATATPCRGGRGSPAQVVARRRRAGRDGSIRPGQASRMGWAGPATWKRPYDRGTRRDYCNGSAPSGWSDAPFSGIAGRSSPIASH
jgi:hypothetical protein